ncbi:unnamed protein product [Pleuronectes platessa]|uniref:Uncharacterized protein n=1 Tax=Pleuronectes platessa TaxID=8262 RepID=A0A9N7TTY1_PLEPL|nr:unnamed protein product [Pleuronectes platessa]
MQVHSRCTVTLSAIGPAHCVDILQPTDAPYIPAEETPDETTPGFSLPARRGISEAGINSDKVMRHRATDRPKQERERQAGDRPGHTGLSESLIWDSDDMPSLQLLLSRALQLYFSEEGHMWRNRLQEQD